MTHISCILSLHPILTEVVAGLGYTSMSDCSIVTKVVPVVPRSHAMDLSSTSPLSAESCMAAYEMVEKIGLYWHFVDLVWVFVFLLFYLL